MFLIRLLSLKISITIILLTGVFLFSDKSAYAIWYCSPGYSNQSPPPCNCVEDPNGWVPEDSPTAYCNDHGQGGACIDCCDAGPNGNGCGQGGGCDCTPECIDPQTPIITLATFNNPNTLIQWQVSDWGKNTNETECENDQCDFQSYNGNGNSKVIANGADITEHCNEAVGNGSLAVIPDSPTATETCTIPGALPGWPGNTIQFTIRVDNTGSGCSAPSANTSIPYPSNERPYCLEIEVEGGRVSATGGFTAAQLNTNLTLEFTAGDADDPYGPPSQLKLCYAVRGQANAFYQNPGNWYCFDPVYDTNTFSTTTTLNAMITNYSPDSQPNPPVVRDAIDKYGFLLATRVYDNVNTTNYCSTNPAYYSGNGVWVIPPNPLDPCDGGNCQSNIFNRPPSVTSFSQNSTIYIGTEPDDDNGLECVDNNPYSYKMTVSDPDGSADIDLVHIDLASNNTLVNPDPDNEGQRRWEMRSSFGKNFYGTDPSSTNVFAIRDTNIPGTMCFNEAREQVPRDYVSNFNCMKMPDGHNWEKAVYDPNETLDGVPVNVYYLNNDIEVFSGGRITRMQGGSSWQSASYVAYEIGGNRVFVNFKIEFLPNSDFKWNGTYNQVFYVRDILGPDSIAPGEDRTFDIGDAMVNVDNRMAHHKLGTSIIDLRSPEITIDTPVVLSASKMRVDWDASDSNLYDTGVNRVVGESGFTPGEGQIDPPGAIKNITALVSGDAQVPGSYLVDTHFPLGNPFLWNVRNINQPTRSRGEEIDLLTNEEGTFNFEAQAQDRACNATTDQMIKQLNLPWTATMGGLVYSAQSTEIVVTPYGETGDDGLPTDITSASPPFDFLKENLDLSTEWLGAGLSPAGERFIRKYVDTGAFGNRSYSDANNRPNYWIEYLNDQLDYQLSSNPSEYHEVVLGGALSGPVSSQGCPADKKCILRRGTLSQPENLNINGTLRCNRKTAIIVNGDLTINADILLPDLDQTNGCIILVTGDVTVNGASYLSDGSTIPRYDTINAFILAEGAIKNKEADTNEIVRDGLRISGSMLGFGHDTEGNSIVLERSLKLLDNFLYPSQVLKHDMRYLFIARELFGGEKDTYKSEVGFKGG